MLSLEVNFPDPLRLPLEPCRAEGLRHRLPRTARTRLAAVGLLGGSSRPGPFHRPTLCRGGPGRRQGHAAPFGRRHRPERAAGQNSLRPDASTISVARERGQSRLGEEGDPCPEGRKDSIVPVYIADIATRPYCDLRATLHARSPASTTINNAGRFYVPIEATTSLPRLLRTIQLNYIRRRSHHDGAFFAGDGRQAPHATSSTSARAACW